MKTIVHIDTSDEVRAAIGQHLHGRKVLASRKDVTFAIEAMFASFVNGLTTDAPGHPEEVYRDHPNGDLTPGRLEPENDRVREALVQLKGLGYVPIGRYQGDLVVQYRGDDQHDRRVHQRVDSTGRIFVCRSGSYRRAPTHQQ